MAVLWCGPVLWYCGVVVAVDVIDVVVVVAGSTVEWTCAVVIFDDSELSDVAVIPVLRITL